VRKKLIEVVAVVLFILAVFTFSIECKTIRGQIISLTVSIIELLISAILVNKYYIDGKWR
jgi:nucleoside permease NupC